MKNNKQVYIPSIEASELYSHMVRDKEIEFNYCGMIPYSLELNKLRKEGLTVDRNKITGKEKSNDVINVKFNRKVTSGDQLVKRLMAKSESTKGDYKQKLIDFAELIDKEKQEDKWNGISPHELREELYMNGFYIREIDTETGEINDTKYVVYKRSSSKSRTGQCLFIKESLHDVMIEWSRLYLPFKKDSPVDYASLLAYESLVGSSLEDEIVIDPKSILIVDDVDSKFKKKVNVVQSGSNGFLESVESEATVSNSLFDGESLLDSSFFEDNQSMLLLRNHMFKSAAFNTNIQLFLQDHCPDNVEYDKWKIKNMYNESMNAKDIKFIITPSSLKALKFHDTIGTEKDLWNHWKKIVKKDKNIFGVCKHEKKSKRGLDDEGNILQQTSYQMLNSMPLDEDSLDDFLTFETEYIEKLKNNDDFFIKYLTKEANDMNSNLMMVDFYKTNIKFANTKIFKEFRKSEIKKYVVNMKRGKIRMNGDYCVLLGNPLEFLMHSIGKLDSSNVSLNCNQVYTTLFDFDKELVAFRNPHTSPSNVLVIKNTYVSEINKYFNLTNNIVCVNAIDFEIQDILSGCDYDSDTMAIFDNDKLLEIGKRCFGKYNVCINNVQSQKKKYSLNNADMCVIDNQLSSSQRNIGKVVNLGQLCMSTYWDRLSKGQTEIELSDLMKKIDIMTVLSGICIDLAKKLYEIDITKEVNYVAKSKDLYKKKPMFWKYISKSETINDRIVDYSCPMDILYKKLDELPYATHRENIDFMDLINEGNIVKGNRKQKIKIIEYVEEMNSKINSINADGSLTSDERNEMVDNIIKYYRFKVQKFKVKSDTMYGLINNIITNKRNIAIKLLNILYETQKETFLKSIKNN